VLTVSLADVHVFGTGLIRGRIRPAAPGARIELALVRGTTTVVERTAALKQGVTFSIRVPVDEPGVYRAKASFSDPDHAPVSVRSAAVATSAPTLHVGSSGPSVRMLESRLVELRYHLAGANDGEYDLRTADAVMAFRKVQGLDLVGTVDASVWKALGDPRVPRPRRTKPDFHIEVNQTLQVLYVVQDGQVADILHVSTGKPSTPTHDGTFRVWLKVPGYNDKAMYYSSFFDNGRAIHGYSDVPTYNASHGCVRIPIWAAKWMYGLASIGTTVIVYH
jgi:lipoprotein-anchoring transpeptidase ErfK/SrfK